MTIDAAIEAAHAGLYEALRERWRHPHGSPGRGAALLRARGHIVQLRAFTMPLSALEAKAAKLIASDHTGEQMIGQLYRGVAMHRRGE